jgi:hypothetical protein
VPSGSQRSPDYSGLSGVTTRSRASLSENFKNRAQLRARSRPPLTRQFPPPRFQFPPTWKLAIDRKGSRP